MVFVIDTEKRPCNMVTEARARWLLDHGRAAVFRMYPFVIILKESKIEQHPKHYTLKIDPGAKTTGMVLIDQDGRVTTCIELEHRAEQVKKNLDTRRGARRNRRQRETRYRKPKWGNKTLKKGSKFSADSPRPEGWMPPSVKSTVDNIETWIRRISKYCCLEHIYIESVKFDFQKMDNPDIHGIEYQHGELFGYEVREYLLEKYQHKCQYCNGESKDSILEVEHKDPKGQGGSNKVSNLTITCHTCNQEKGNRTLEQWKEELKEKPDSLSKTRLNNIEKVEKNQIIGGSNRYSAWVNSSRWELVNRSKKYGEVHTSSGSVTKYNRIQNHLPKEHYYDALCVQEVPKGLRIMTPSVLCIKARGRGSHFRGRTNSCGIITKQLSRQKIFFGFQTGDMVKASVPKGKKAGIYTGRVAVRKSGSFNIQTGRKTVQGISHRYCKAIQRCDGYSYGFKSVNGERPGE